MYQSIIGIWNFDVPSENPGHYTITHAGGVGNLTITWVGWRI